MIALNQIKMVDTTAYNQAQPSNISALYIHIHTFYVGKVISVGKMSKMNINSFSFILGI